MAKKQWRCFHCGDVFTSAFKAEEHFGRDEGRTPACQIVGAASGLITALREAEDSAADAWFKLHEEMSDIAKAMYAQNSRHQQSLLRAEELGYERGLRDARAETWKVVAHLVWKQGLRAIDDLEDYYEVARDGEKSADGSEPFPVYAPSIPNQEGDA